MPSKTDVRAYVEGIIEYARNGAIDPMTCLPAPEKEKTRGKLTECEHFLLVGDAQAGLRTPSFNRQVLWQRVANLAEGLRRIVTWERKSRPINKLHVGFLGDMTHHENIGKNVNWAELEESVKAQVFDNAAPAFAKFLQEMATVYNKVEVDCVYGNHGVFGRQYHHHTNADILTYEVMKARLADQPNVDVRVSEDFCAKPEIMGRKFFLFHGHQIKMGGLVPIYGIQRSVARWNISEGGFYAACCGHFHCYHHWHHNGIPIVVNGTFLTDDRWTREMIKMAPTLGQVLLTVHPKRGIIDSKLVDLGV